MSPDILEMISSAARNGRLFAYFGYGSLVNRATHRTQIYGAAKASVRGWRRHWQGRPDTSDDQPVSLLSVKPEADPEHDLPGLLVFDHIENLPALDERESGYVRREVDPSAIEISESISISVPVYIYEAKPASSGDQDHGILQSYLDAVLHGYMSEYGTEAVGKFVAETHAFDTPVIKDRHAPRYPRHVALHEDHHGFFDDVLSQHGIVYR